MAGREPVAEVRGGTRGMLRDSEELIADIVVRSADQRLPDIAREIVDLLRRGTYDAVDISRMSYDQHSILVVGISWPATARNVEP